MRLVIITRAFRRKRPSYKFGFVITRAFRRKRLSYKFGFVIIFFVFCVQSQNAVLLQRMRNYYVITRAHAMVHGMM